MSEVRIEVFVEPFKENDPGPHVIAAVDAMSSAGVVPDMGPFATTASGDIDTVLAAASALLRDAFDNGATAVQLRIDRA